MATVIIEFDYLRRAGYCPLNNMLSQSELRRAATVRDREPRRAAGDRGGPAVPDRAIRRLDPGDARRALRLAPDQTCRQRDRHGRPPRASDGTQRNEYDPVSDSQRVADNAGPPRSRRRPRDRVAGCFRLGLRLRGRRRGRSVGWTFRTTSQRFVSASGRGESSTNLSDSVTRISPVRSPRLVREI